MKWLDDFIDNLPELVLVLVTITIVLSVSYVLLGGLQ